MELELSNFNIFYVIAYGLKHDKIDMECLSFSNIMKIMLSLENEKHKNLFEKNLDSLLQ